MATVRAGRDELAKLEAIVEEYEPEIIYVGYPLDLRGRLGPAAEFVAQKAAVLAQRVAPIEVRLIDERMSTVSASRSLGSVGRDTRSQRGIIDQAAAVEILQTAVDVEERLAEPAGEPLHGNEDE